MRDTLTVLALVTVAGVLWRVLYWPDLRRTKD